MIEQQVPFWVNAISASLLQVLRAKELGTYEHCLRVGELSKQLAAKAGLNHYQQKVTEIAGFLHDLGETAVDQDIMQKPTKLNAIEFELMKSHVGASEEFLRPLAAINPFFKDVLAAIHSHHEHFVGTGYPDKLKANQIPMISRILTLIDSYDAMTTNRSYKQALTLEETQAEIIKSSGSQFDPQLVNLFIQSHATFKKSSILDLENYLSRQVA